jgi:hypothetical protein
MISGGRRQRANVRRFGPILIFCITILFARSTTSPQDSKVDTSASASLTTYLRQHRLPLVGAQVLRGGTGNARIVLYGFVATEFGKNDAARQAVDYVEHAIPAGATAPIAARDATPQVENRIEVRPEIARMGAQGPAAGTADTSNESIDQLLDDIDRYGVTMAPVDANTK